MIQNYPATIHGSLQFNMYLVNVYLSAFKTNAMKYFKHAWILMIVTFLLVGCSSETPTEDEEQIAEDIIAEPATGIQSITFPSLDGLEITANLYEIDAEAPVIVLCHQARFNKFEYEGIAQKLNDKGFNCIAIDQRSGGPIANEVNQTNILAGEQGKPTDFLDAEQDIVAAVKYAAENYTGKVVLWGSSYSSTLALYVGIEQDEVDAIVSFSPGNYFKSERGDLTQLLPELEKPFFLTSSKIEAPEVAGLVANMERSEQQVVFAPEGNGHHGSRALWEHQDGGGEYWIAIENFLEMIK